MSWRVGLLALVLLALGSAGPPAQAAATRDLAVGIAPFEEVGPPGADFPTWRGCSPTGSGREASAASSVRASSAAGRRRTPRRSSSRPGARPGRSPSWWSAAPRAWAELSLDVHLCPAARGAALATRVAEAGRVEDLEAAVVRLADQLVKDAAAAPVVPAVAARGAGGSTDGSGGGGSAAASADAAETPEEEPGRLGFGKKDDPIDIQSRELEMLQKGAERRFVFKGNVHVTQGTMTLTSQKLEALYPDGANKPERLVATGRVVLTETDQEGKKQAFCERATYTSANRRVICGGEPAELHQGQDRVRGKEIEFDLDTSQMVIRGGADVRLGTTGPCKGR